MKVKMVYDGFSHWSKKNKNKKYGLKGPKIAKIFI